MSDSPSAAPRPASVWIILAILLLQAAVVLFTTITEVLTPSGGLLDAAVLDAAGQIALIVLYLLAAVVLIVLGFKVLAGSRAARTPIMVLQLLVVVLSFSFFAEGAVLIGLGFLLPAAVVLVSLFLGATQQWLDPQE